METDSAVRVSMWVRMSQTMFMGTRLGQTYVGIPLEMFVDEPEGRDNSYDSEKPRHEPSNIVCCKSEAINKEKHKKTMLETHPEIPRSRAETKKALSGVLSAESKSHSPTWAAVWVCDKN